MKKKQFRIIKKELVGGKTTYTPQYTTLADKILFGMLFSDCWFYFRKSLTTSVSFDNLIDAKNFIFDYKEIQTKSTTVIKYKDEAIT